MTASFIPDASGIEFTPEGDIEATNVQDAIVEAATGGGSVDQGDIDDAVAAEAVIRGAADTALDARVDTLEGSVASGDAVARASIADHLADTVDAHDASAVSVSPAGTIAATDVQSALVEVAGDAAAALTTGLASKADLVGGVIPSAQIPAIATGQTVTVANQAAMLALTTAQVQPGDVAIRTDLSGRRYILAATDPSVLANWIALEVPDAVSSVNGQQGAVTLAKSDVGLGNVDNTSDANKPVSTAAQTALDLKAPLASPALTGTPTVPTAAQGTNTSQAASTAYVQTEAGLLIPKSLVDAKGDLLVGTANDTVARLAVGTNDYVLTADSAQASGVKWAAAAVAVATTGLYAAGGYYVFGPLGTHTPAEATEQCLPFIVGQSVTMDRLAVWVTSAGTTGAVVRLGIRADNGRGMPGAVSLDAGTVAATSTGVAAITISKALTPGLYWLSTTCQGAASTRPTLRGGVATSIGQSPPVGWQTSIATDSQFPQGYTASGSTSGALGSFTYASTIGAAGQPTVFGRFV